MQKIKIFMLLRQANPRPYFSRNLAPPPFFFGSVLLTLHHLAACSLLLLPMYILLGGWVGEYARQSTRLGEIRYISGSSPGPLPPQLTLDIDAVGTSLQAIVGGYVSGQTCPWGHATSCFADTVTDPKRRTIIYHEPHTLLQHSSTIDKKVPPLNCAVLSEKSYSKLNGPLL